jgi:hypothetical protein
MIQQSEEGAPVQDESGSGKGTGQAEEAGGKKIG